MTIKGKVPERIAAELRYLCKQRDHYLKSGDIEKTLDIIDIYNRVYCRWYFQKKEDDRG